MRYKTSSWLYEGTSNCLFYGLALALAWISIQHACSSYLFVTTAKAFAATVENVTTKFNCNKSAGVDKLKNLDNNFGVLLL